VAAIVQELFSFGFYKRNQGRIARQATFFALLVIVALGAWSLSRFLTGFIADDWPDWQRYTFQYFIPLGLLVLGGWASFRVVQIPSFADFLISVEGEMNKVSWPSRSELFRATLVVILVIFFLAALLFAYDYILQFLLRKLDDLIKALF
jgi:preprotein translocase subunit SecE